MAEHIAYFVLKKDFKNLKKGSKTKIRSSINDLFEIRKGQQSISFRKDKWNDELFKPLYVDIDLVKLQKELTIEFNNLLETKIVKEIPNMGLIIEFFLSWTEEFSYSLQEVEVYYEASYYKKSFKTKLEKELADVILSSLNYETNEIFEALIKKEQTAENKKINLFIKKCQSLSNNLGFDVFESYLS